MKLKNKKNINNNELIINVNFTYRDLTAIEEFLEKKQSEGWLLVKYDKKKMKFKKCEPSHSRYCCEAYKAPNRPKYDEEYITFCEDAGWEFIASDWNGIYIFRTDDETLPRVMTDDKMKLSIMAKSFMREESVLIILISIVVAICSFYWLYKSITNFASFYNPSNFTIPLFAVDILVICESVMQIAWYIKKKKLIQNGQQLTTNNQEEFEKQYANMQIRTFLYLALLLFTEMLSYSYGGIAFYAFYVISCLVNLKRAADISRRSKKKIAVFAVGFVAVFLAVTVSSAVLSHNCIDDELTKAVETNFNMVYENNLTEASYRSQFYHFCKDDDGEDEFDYDYDYDYYDDYAEEEPEGINYIKVYAFGSQRVQGWFMKDLLKHKNEYAVKSESEIDEKNGLTFYTFIYGNEKTPSCCVAMCGKYIIEIDGWDENISQMLKDTFMTHS
ncbi:MAG: DUF2812 domain-containing protein [Faecalibacterium sp.]|nr:DUF2812 domain-containing protein [Ruminococcus sp.]MCM1393244.1 DUF2812 domain-containing protein [Ruminococcus sp.]MCM1486467.1 DUF2812 domain-containing protein [Faecalibacterium sp.]